MRLALLALSLMLTACAQPRIEYQALPAWLIPGRPVLPTIKAADLACLSDATYTSLALRDRLRAKETAELRALLGGANAR